jgi:hypothetical protein
MPSRRATSSIVSNRSSRSDSYAGVPTCALMRASVEDHPARKLVHKDMERPSEKEQLSDRDDLEASFVPRFLGDDPVFLEKARRVAAAEPLQREVVAVREARDYAPNRGARQSLVVSLLLLAAEEPWKAWGSGAPARRTFFANVAVRAVWVDEPPDELDGERVRDRSPRLAEGAKRFAWVGARKCMGCGGDLASDRFRSRARPTHCSACEAQFGPSIRESHQNAIREAVDAATRGHRRRRAARRAT